MNSMMDFNNYNDKELIYLIKDGSNPKALELIVDKYNILSLKIIRTFKIVNYDEEDFLSEANGILMKCIRHYSNEGSFYTYFSVSLKRYLIKIKNQELECVIHLGEDVIDSSTIDDEYLNEMKVREIYKRSSNLQRQIADLILRGFAVSEISKKLNIPINKIYYEMRKLRFSDQIKINK